MTALGLVPYDSFERALLASGQSQKAPARAMRRTAARLGVSLPAAGLVGLAVSSSSANAAAGGFGGLAAAEGATTGGIAAGSTGSMGAAAGATTAASGAAAVVAAQPVAKATLALVAKYLGAGVMAGAVAVGGAHGVMPESPPAARNAAEPAVQRAAPAFGVNERRPRTIVAGLAPSPAIDREALAVPPAEPASSHEAPGSTPIAASGTRSFNAAGTPAQDTELDPDLVLPEPGGTPAAASVPEAGGVVPDTVGTNVASFPLEQNPVPAVKSAKKKGDDAVGLELERLLIGRARLALQKGRPRAALRELGAYAVRCRVGVMRSEANLLRVEALLRTGQREPALWLAREEIARTSSRKTVRRVREMFAQPSNELEESSNARKD